MFALGASSPPLKDGFQQSALSELTWLSWTQEKVSKSSHWSSSKYLFAEELCFWRGEKEQWQEEK